MEGLARASAFIVTRANEAANTDVIESVLRRYTVPPDIPVLRSPAPVEQCEGRNAPHSGMTHVRCIAFCGLGNPQTFWRTLDQLGVAPVSRFDYGDHHRYTPAEMRRLARYAKDLSVETLLTTAKDAVNLCPEFAEIVHPLRVYWLEIGVEIERRAELVELIRKISERLRACPLLRDDGLHFLSSCSPDELADAAHKIVNSLFQGYIPSLKSALACRCSFQCASISAEIHRAPSCGPRDPSSVARGWTPVVSDVRECLSGLCRSGLALMFLFVLLSIGLLAEKESSTKRGVAPVARFDYGDHHRYTPARCAGWRAA